MKKADKIIVNKKLANTIKKDTKKVKKKDVKKILDKKDEIKAKAKKLNPNTFRKLINRVDLALMLINDYWNKKYTKVPWKTIAMIVLAISYFILPFDLIPDFLQPLGYIDDAAMFSLVFAAIQKDLEDYCEWKNLDFNKYF